MRGSCIVDLGEPGRDGAVVGGRDGVVRVVGPLLAANNVAPEGTDAVASGDGDDLVVGQGDFPAG